MTEDVEWEDVGQEYHRDASYLLAAYRLEMFCVASIVKRSMNYLAYLARHVFEKDIKTLFRL